MRDTAAYVREEFLRFYREKDHRLVKSAPLVPGDDPTLLFTSAGMVQFKKYYSSTEPLEFRRAVSIQKCLRASDLEEVGYTPRHLTFFEMLGHFSFGDYFKREAILWNWELFTKTFKLPLEKLKVSVFEEDDEAYGIWKDEVGLAPGLIYRLGAKDNFWGPAGDTGACGPSSELYYDLGEELGCGGSECGPGCSCDRWIEVGNFVFPQFDMQPDKTLAPLPNRGIDTGIGLDRLVMVLEGKRTLFETSLFQPCIRRISEITGRPYEGADKPAFHIVADHVRGLTFALTEGVLPSNEGRGYVIRRIIRRAAVQGHRMGLERPFLAELAGLTADQMGSAYPEVREALPSVRMALQLEEERFQATLAQGLTRFEDVASRTPAGGTIPGREIFTLYDTYGFPPDLTALLARERGLAIDESGFDVAMQEQRERSRAGARFHQKSDDAGLEWRTLDGGPHSAFLGHEALELNTRIVRHAPVPDAAGEFWAVLAETPFYAESGGQVGDTGMLGAPGFRARVLDAVKRGEEIRHRIHVDEGAIPEGPVTARVEEGPRRQTMRNHTATHLLHSALRRVLGTHVTQAGSLVEPGRLRFDFTHPKGMTAEEISEVERIVNEQILLDRPVETCESSFDEALGEGVIALFGEKYGDRVRRVEIGEFSRELCGGTHVGRTGQIGAFLILSEAGIAAGTRRIEAVTGHGAVGEARAQMELFHRLQQVLPGVREELPDRVQGLQQEISRLRKENRELKNRGPSDELAPLLASAVRMARGAMIIGKLDAAEGTDMRALGDRLRGGLGSGAGLLAVHSGGKITLLVVVTDDLVEAGTVRADAVVRAAAQAAGGNGGGRPHMAMAGVRDPALEEAALDAGREALAGALGGEI